MSFVKHAEVQLQLFDGHLPTLEQGDEMDKRTMLRECKRLFETLDEIPLARRVDCINAIREELAKHSPFNHEPVDCVRWVKSDAVQANDYNPNSVARGLRQSPIVAKDLQGALA